MASLADPPTVKPGYKHVNSGGSIHINPNGRLFSVFDVLQSTGAAVVYQFIVTLSTKGETAPGFAAGDTLTYNSKGTNNHNADTVLTVTSVIGPFQFKCSSPTPLNG